MYTRIVDNDRMYDNDIVQNKHNGLLFVISYHGDTRKVLI